MKDSLFFHFAFFYQLNTSRLVLIGFYSLKRNLSDRWNTICRFVGTLVKVWKNMRHHWRNKHRTWHFRNDRLVWSFNNNICINVFNFRLEELCWTFCLFFLHYLIQFSNIGLKLSFVNFQFGFFCFQLFSAARVFSKFLFKSWISFTFVLFSLDIFFNQICKSYNSSKCFFFSTLSFKRRIHT